MPKKIILDCDTGSDDAVAIILAAMHPAISLEAVTTVNGNNPVDYCTENTLKALDLIGATVPVYRGMSHPIVRKDFPPEENRVKRGEAGDVHGLELPFPSPTSEVQSMGAVEFLVETYRKPSEIVLVPVGPLTNVAAAISLSPEIVENIPEVVIMGGGFTVGNITASAEFNIWADPEAAHVVFNAGFKKITVLTLDVTHTAGLVSEQNCAELVASGNVAAEAVATLVRKRIGGYAVFQPMDVPMTAPVHDALCVAYLVDPSVVNVQAMFTDIELHGELTLGRTVFDPGNRSKKPFNSHVAFTGDRDVFWSVLKEALCRPAVR